MSFKNAQRPTFNAQRSNKKILLRMPFSPEYDSTGMLEFRNDGMMGKMNTGTGRGARACLAVALAKAGLRACGAVHCATPPAPHSRIRACPHSRIHGGLS